LGVRVLDTVSRSSILSGTVNTGCMNSSFIGSFKMQLQTHFNTIAVIFTSVGVHFVNI